MEYQNVLLLAIVLCLNSLGLAQVGINTVSPTQELDVNGEVRIRTIPEMNESPNLLSADAIGNVGMITNAKLLREVYVAEAQTPVDLDIPTAVFRGTIDLGLSNSVVIPAGVQATVIVSYTVPLGMNNFGEFANGYYGIQFLRNGIEAPAGSRKFSIPHRYRDPAEIALSLSMISVGASYIETIDNTSNSNDLSVIYSLFGYVEQFYASTLPVQYRFNMYAAPPNDNFNWGRATLVSQLYIHN